MLSYSILPVYVCACVWIYACVWVSAFWHKLQRSHWISECFSVTTSISPFLSLFLSHISFSLSPLSFALFTPALPCLDTKSINACYITHCPGSLPDTWRSTCPCTQAEKRITEPRSKDRKWDDEGLQDNVWVTQTKPQDNWMVPRNGWW